VYVGCRDLGLGLLSHSLFPQALTSKKSLEDL
jgi:hypothetical protein